MGKTSETPLCDNAQNHEQTNGNEEENQVIDPAVKVLMNNLTLQLNHLVGSRVSERRVVRYMEKMTRRLIKTIHDFDVIVKNSLQTIVEREKKDIEQDVLAERTYDAISSKVVELSAVLVDRIAVHKKKEAELTKLQASGQVLQNQARCFDDLRQQLGDIKSSFYAISKETILLQKSTIKFL